MCHVQSNCSSKIFNFKESATGSIFVRCVEATQDIIPLFSYNSLCIVVKCSLLVQIVLLESSSWKQRNKNNCILQIHHVLLLSEQESGLASIVRHFNQFLPVRKLLTRTYFPLTVFSRPKGPFYL